MKKLIIILPLFLSFFISCQDANINIGNLSNDNSSNVGSTEDDSIDQSPVISDGNTSDEFFRTYSLISRNSVVIFWQHEDIKKSSRSVVEYGVSSDLGSRSVSTTDLRRAQFHRLNNLLANTRYFYRMINIYDTGIVRSEILEFQTDSVSSAIEFPGGAVSSAPYTLSQNGATYILTEDISVAGHGINITGSDIVLDLNGHTVSFGNSISTQVFGVRVSGSGTIVVKNGHIVQGGISGDYSSAIESRWRSHPLEVYGISTDVSAPNAYPMRLFGSATNVSIHHNNFFSSVTELESRHYPGNDLLKVDSSGPNIRIYDNLFTQGTHRALTVSGTGSDVEISYNDIAHHARFVNGYAFSLGVSGGNINVHHNSVTSTGRGVHLSGRDITYHDNYMMIKGHMTLSDLPANTYPFIERMVELHGIKFEGSNSTGNTVYNNYVEINQYLPDETYEYVPATPLNIACYNPNARNDIYNNTFVAKTHYANTRHGGYGDSGQWASAIYFVAMDKGAASSGSYSANIHDNQFISNDLFISSTGTLNMTILMNNNSFNLPSLPLPTNSRIDFRNISSSYITQFQDGNLFQ